ncbi:hypothetical protein DFJ58DRAFT_820183 [Suillus subalutaceus]|uniref:uncharacterized protein n=1 Tax=Suillus subalutaceus TaxID=48586 RepID=UPI001B873DF2|nr:uncharacterized protein DFJ58DRAFT_820183 [Suillus subalutaceus]KAG1835914.1 hypothetical protein DFJ58DRAFT_820183 [Suillus subalutaceus]
MTKMVSCYTAGVKRTQVVPCTIAFYNCGGIVAFEVAKQLAAMDNKVKFVSTYLFVSLTACTKLTGWVACSTSRIYSVSYWIMMLMITESAREQGTVRGRVWTLLGLNGRKKSCNSSGSVSTVTVFATFPFTEAKLISSTTS